MDVSFLKDIKLEAVVKSAPKSRTAAPTLPENADLRVFKNGKVFPSKAFAERAELEFVTKTDGIVRGNGLDIFSSLDWGMIQGKLPQEVMFLAAVPKALAKVDMWASTKYDESGTPKASVFTQGSNTFAKGQLIIMLTAVYGIDWEVTEYVDLEVVQDSPIVSPTGVYHLPKTVTTGKYKGESTYIRRENINICPLIVKDVKTSAVKAPKQMDMFATNPVTPEEAIDNETPPIAEDNTDDVDLQLGTSDPGEDWASQFQGK